VFEGFVTFDIQTTGTTIHGQRGGSGPPVLLLHGMPETHLMWHRVAPILAQRFTVVVTDLRGFGDSGTQPSSPDHSPYSMREIARDQVEVMASLGHERFAVVGHDRGARCAYRLALDHPDSATGLAALDIVPTGDVLRDVDEDFLRSFWVWSFLAAPEPVPEGMIVRAPEVIVDHMLDTWSERPDAFPAQIRSRYVEQFRDPSTVHAICEEYRAALTLDMQHDEADRGRRRITCPTLVLWSDAGPVGDGQDPLVLWETWSDDVRGKSVPAGHFLPEEAPDETAQHLVGFLGALHDAEVM
jgi:haloacetate dehalogenase